MKVIRKIDGKDIASVYIAENEKGNRIEFVESTQPPLSFREKWVLIISTLYGCPVDCKFCDAGGSYAGRLTTDELLFQIDYAVKNRFPEGFIDTAKFKIQFARMGEPAFNMNVPHVLEEIPQRYNYRHFVPSLSSIGPKSSTAFFDRLLEIKKSLYPRDFQLQFSIHSTNLQQRDELLPVKKMDFKEIARYGNQFYNDRGKKITLNFALSQNSIVEADVLAKYFDPEIFLVKLTPVNPTSKANKNKIHSLITDSSANLHLMEDLRKAGFDMILSIGEWEENKIGSNCGQYVNAIEGKWNSDESYTYEAVTV